MKCFLNIGDITHTWRVQQNKLMTEGEEIYGYHITVMLSFEPIKTDAGTQTSQQRWDRMVRSL